MYDPLEDLAAIHGTDKAQHGYLPFYERHFGPLRHSPVSLLEVGVYRGGSIRMWADYFYNGEVLGIDIDPATEFTAKRISTLIGDIKTIGVEGPFDIIIDDGSHLADDITAAFMRLFSLVKPGGWYVIEDWATQFIEGWGGSADGSAASRMVDSVIHHILAENSIWSDEVHVYRQLLFIKRLP